MDCKINVTSRCNAKCRTCNTWKLEGQDMSVNLFQKIIKKINTFNINNVIISGIGELYYHKEHLDIFKAMKKLKCNTTIQTNGSLIDKIPDVKSFIISFNGGDKETYERTTGLNFFNTVNNIKSKYKLFKKNTLYELHGLFYEGNKEGIESFKKLWEDFPGRVRITYKYDNQFGENKTIEKYKRDKRELCDYLTMLTIDSKGRVVLCCHDIYSCSALGNFIDRSKEEILGHKDRTEIINKHLKGEYPWLCAKCNYNIEKEGLTNYVK